MRVYLSGATRQAHIDTLQQVSGAPVMVDYSFREMRSSDFLENFGEGRHLALTNRDVADQAYVAFVHEHHHHFDLVALAPNHIENLKDKALVTVASLDEIPSLIGVCAHIGIGKEHSLEDVQAAVRPLLPVLRQEGVRLHAWGRADKSAVVSGVFASSVSPSWLSGARYGNTYEYVGNLKLVTHHGSKGMGKGVRERLGSKCASLGIDHALLMADDNHAVNLWNAHQWSLFCNDADRAGGYWSRQGADTVKIKDLDLQKINNNESGLAHPQQKVLASQEAGARYLRSCDTCFLSSTCPAFEPSSPCRISTRPKVDTPEDLQDLLNRIIEIQGERVMFAAFAEKAQNMGVNPDVSKEMETLTKLVKDTKEILSPIGENEVTVKMKGSGVISQIFGGYGRGGGGGSKPSQSEKIIDISPLEKNNDEGEPY